MTTSDVFVISNNIIYFGNNIKITVGHVVITQVLFLHCTITNIVYHYYMPILITDGVGNNINRLLTSYRLSSVFKFLPTTSAD